MKKYVTILIGIVVLFAALYGIQVVMKKDRSQADVVDLQAEVVMKSITGEVVRVFEGENKLTYTFGIPETASTSIDMDGALIRVADEISPIATVYISYEGARGYSAIDYINNIIAPHVSVINPTSISTIGSHDWQGAESEGSEWHIASVLNGNWLIVVESKKTMHDTVGAMLASVKVE